MSAFLLAQRWGADVLEIDVRLSRDGHVMVTHDARVDRTCDGHGAVADMNLQELKRLDAGYRFKDLEGRDYRHQGVQLMTLDELFECFPEIRINIDIKDNAQQAARAVTQAILKADAGQRVTVGSFHAPALSHFRQQSADVATAASRQEVAALYFGRQLAPTARYQFLQIPVHYFGIPLTTRRFLRDARKRNIKTVYWTINDRQTMQRLTSLNVSGLVTDRVDIACQLLGKLKS